MFQNRNLQAEGDWVMNTRLQRPTHLRGPEVKVMLETSTNTATHHPGKALATGTRLPWAGSPWQQRGTLAQQPAQMEQEGRELQEKVNWEN